MTQWSSALLFNGKSTAHAQRKCHNLPVYLPASPPNVYYYCYTQTTLSFPCSHFEPVNIYMAYTSLVQVAQFTCLSLNRPLWYVIGCSIRVLLPFIWWPMVSVKMHAKALSSLYILWNRTLVVEDKLSSSQQLDFISSQGELKCWNLYAF